MNRQTHIVSFDDAKRSRRFFASETGSELGGRCSGARASRGRQGGSRRASDAPGAGSSRGAAVARDGMRGASAASARGASAARMRGDLASAAAPAARGARGASRGGRETFRYDGLRDEVRELGDVPATRGARPSPPAGRRPRPSWLPAEDESSPRAERTARDARAEGIEDEPPVGRGLAGRLAKARRSASKAKADREFTRRYGDDAPSAAEPGPRAAVYETQMGRQHKRAARLQDGGASARSAAASRPSGKREGGSARSRLAALGAAAACLLLACLFLYPPAQQYYQEVRERDRLQAEYDAIQQRNDAIQREVDYLSSDAGVQDEARSELGWVLSGERSVSVTGVDVPDDSTFTANIVAGEIPAPDTWYSFLDPLFGVG